MTRGYKKAICIFILPALLSGCWDYNDVNKTSITLSIGVDDVRDNIEFSGEIAKLAPNSSDKKSGDKSSNFYNYIALGKTFEAARADFNAKVSAEDFSGALRVIVFSKEYAQKKGIEAYINRIASSPKFRRSVLTVISSEPPREVFSGKVENAITVGYGIEDTIRYLDKKGAALYKTIQEINSDMSVEAIGYLLPYIKREGNTVKYLGMSAMKDDKLVGIINEKDSNGFLFVLSNKINYSDTFPHPRNGDNLVSIINNFSKRKIKTSYKDGNINIDIDLKLNSKIEYEYSNNDLITKDDISKLEEIISNRVKEDIISAVKRSQEEFKCDVFGFARYFKADNPQKYKNIKWEEEYLRATVNVNVKATIKTTSVFDLEKKRRS
ncbi:Ger(x)C family spore germination protein [Clostridium swellfunianum]|uniref:Ger(x)C family spore germination protein n=1 Tax=Clostridium swellfunianum TaxID=1367462 RepID=UPI00202E9B5E|nr:Ger(x)C family spore germination protein [Clostridium swellfunianum]MCM0647323.1 Ger(x)C family spore germination protein [Clostridium swellfunianum]